MWVLTIKNQDYDNNQHTFKAVTDNWIKICQSYVTVDLFLAGWCSGERLRFDSGSNPVVDAI